LVAVLDADKEGFLRSERSLIQTCGRAARNIRGQVILYADQVTGSMARAIEESHRRRQLQLEYNEKNHITPASIQKAVDDILASPYEADYVTVPVTAEPEIPYLTAEAFEKRIKKLEKKMKEAAKKMEFEEAARLRDEIKGLQTKQLEVMG
jgi:excinuclease ABC subunit B